MNKNFDRRQKNYNLNEDDSRHIHKMKKNRHDQKLHKSIDSALKRKNWKELAELGYDEYK